MRHGDVEIVVGSSLLSQKSVYGPTTVNVDLKPVFFEQVEELDHI